MIIAAAALTAATSQDAKALAQASEAQSRSGESARTAVPSERRKVARATTGKDADFASLKPLIQRAKVDASLTETRDLLDKAERQLTNGHREQAMLTLDGAGLQLEKARPAATGAGSNFIDSFLELERRESSLREKLGQPGFVPLKSAPAPAKPDAPAEPVPSEEKKDAPAKPVRDELPVG